MVPMKTVEQLKADFTAKPGGKKVLTAPRIKVLKGSDKVARVVKIMFFGATGSGKTYAITSLLRLGYRVLLITTDIGGSGLNTVILALGNDNPLLANITEIILNNDEEVQQFLDNPAAVYPGVYDEDFDFAVWDGFGAWQQVQLSDAIGKMPVTREGGKEVAAEVESGLMFEQAQWGMMRNGTVRALHKFCTLHNKKTGKIWHKIITAHEGYKSKPPARGQEGKGYTETKMPLLQGAGGILSGGAFDLIIRTKVEKEETPQKVTKNYIYQIEAENLNSKNRGFELPNSMPADMGVLWTKLSTQLGIDKDAKDESLKEDLNA